MIRSVLVLIVVFLIATFPATWLLMLLFGNLFIPIGYWGILPLGILVSAFLSGSGSHIYVTGNR